MIQGPDIKIFVHSEDVPHVDWCGIVCRAEQNIWRSIPQSHHLVGVGLCGNRLGSSQTWKKNTQIMGLTG